MQRLIPINVGQQANDRSGDPLRDGMAKVNENFAKVTTAMDAVETAVAQTSALAGSARDIAAAALPAVQKNRPGGVAPLDADGKVPAGNLPDSVPMSQKGAAGGVAPLDAAGKVPAGHLPDSIPMSQKGAADGVTPLDASGKVPVAHLPKLDYLPVIQRGAPDGVAPLDAQGKVPAANLPAVEDAIPLAQKGQPNGVAALAADGKVPAAQLPLIESIPTGFVAWAPKRGAIWAGWIPGDGQLVSRATFPDLAAAVADGAVPVVSEAEWLADPLKRGAYTLGDGTTSIRVPDYNGKSAGAIGAAFLRGDGTLSVANGVIKASQNKAHGHTFQSPQYLYVETDGSGSFLGAPSTSTPVFLRYTSVEGGPEAHPSFISGCFVIKAFGAVSRPGSVDAAQLASRLAVLEAALQTDIDFKLLYPGGSATTPGIIYQNTAQTIDNPFPGSPVQVVVEHELNGQWFEPGWFCSTDRTGAPNDPYSGWGIKAAHSLVTDKIIVRAGKNGTATDPAIAGGSWVGAWSQNQVNARFRVKVWKLKGRIAG